MKRLANFERELLRLPEGPPSPHAMDSLVTALLWDGELDRALVAADDMVNHHIHRGDDLWSREHGFAYWLGVRSTIQTFGGVQAIAREGRARRRKDRSAQICANRSPNNPEPAAAGSSGGGSCLK